MDFQFSQSQKLLARKARQFAHDHVCTYLKSMDAEDRFPAELRSIMGELGFWGLPYPTSYGGAGNGYLSYALALEEISRESAAVAATLSVHTMACATVFHHGTDEQKHRFLPALLSGNAVGSFSFTELATGSNPKAITANAREEGDYYILNGAKVFSSNSTLDGYAIVFAKDSGKQNQITAFIVPKDVRGFTKGDRVRKMGLFGFETAPFTLSDVRIPKGNAVGGEPMRGRGFDILLDIISVGKLGISAQSLGLAERALEEAIRYAEERHQLNKPLRMFPTIQVLIADMATEVEAARWIVYHAAYQREEGNSIPMEGAMAKLFCARSARSVIDKALSVHGCYGYTKDFVVERLYRDVKLGELYEGTQEMQQILIASKILWPR